MKIIDAHSHIGKDYFWREANIKEYVNMMKQLNIDIGFIMPVPSQVVINNASKRYLIWFEDESNLKYKSDYFKEDIFNPYRIVNQFIYYIVSKEKEKQLEFIPLIHPTLDTKEYMFELVRKCKPLALKIHGVGSGIGPNDISNKMIQTLKQINLPIIVHTDYCESPKNCLEMVRKKNNPFDWAQFFIKNELNGFLAHGARLDIKTLNLINSSSNLVIGIAPDLKIMRETFKHVNKTTKPYLEFIKNNVDINKILFDIDYSWNVDEKNNLDINFLERINQCFNEEQKELILSKNAINFFNIKGGNNE